MAKIIQNQTIGEIISKRRKDLELTLDEIESELKIRSKFLKSIETNRFTIFPSHTQAKGFIKNYAKLLDLNYDMLVAIYKRDIENVSMKRKINIVNEIEVGEEKKPNKFKDFFSQLQFLKITPKKIAITFSIFIVLFFGSYIFSTVRQVFNKPELIIENPVSISGNYIGNLEYFDNKVVIKGKTEPGTTIKINEVPIFLDASFAFESSEIPLPSDSNKVVIVAQNNFGSETKIELNLVKPVKNIKLMQASILVNSNTQIKIDVNGENRLEREVIQSEIISFDATETINIQVGDPNALTVKINDEEFKLLSTHVLFTNLKKEIKQENLEIQ